MFNLAEAIVADGLNSLSKRVVDSQSKKDMRATGASAKSMRVTVASTDTTVAGQLIGASYWYYQQNGRGPGRYKYPSRKMVEAVRLWLDARGIDAPVYAVAYTVNRDGWKPKSPNVLSEVLNRDTVVAEILPRLRDMALNDIRSEIFKP